MDMGQLTNYNGLETEESRSSRRKMALWMRYALIHASLVRISLFSSVFFPPSAIFLKHILITTNSEMQVKSLFYIYEIAF